MILLGRVITPDGEINPSLEKHAIKSNLGQTQKRVLFSSKNVPGDTRRGRGTDAVPLSAAREVGITGMQQWHRQALVPWGDDPWAGSWAAQSPRNTHKKKLPKNPAPSTQGNTKNTWKNQFAWENSSEALWKWLHSWSFAHVESLLHGEVTVLGHVWFPQRSLQENSCRKTVGESQLSPRQWGWLGNGCDFYSPKFDRLPRFVLFVFLRETFYGTQKYFANENKKATYRRLCEPPHRQMLLNTVFNWD